MIASEIMLPPHAPEIYLDRATLWNAVENCEKHPKAQLAYSFDIAMQNELTLEENMELARKFVQEQFVAKGMIADLAFHSPEKEDGGIPNPHFHVMTTMRPLNPDGTWGQKQRREYLLDEDGNRIRDKNGDYMFNAVHTTDWHEPVGGFNPAVQFPFLGADALCFHLPDITSSPSAQPEPMVRSWRASITVASCQRGILQKTFNIVES